MNSLPVTKHGFTLMEVLIALLVLSICFTAAFSTLSTQSKNLLYLQNKTAAHWVAQNISSQLILGQLKFSAYSSELNGTQNMLDRPWAWHAKLLPLSNTAIYKIDLTVGLENRNPIIHETSYLFKDDVTL